MAYSEGEIHKVLWEDGRPRPVVVVSRDSLNNGDYVVAVPITASQFESRRRLPHCVPFLRGSYGLPLNCVAQAEGITVVHRSDMEPGGPIAKLSAEDFRKIVNAIGYVIRSECEPLP